MLPSLHVVSLIQQSTTNMWSELGIRDITFKYSSYGRSVVNELFKFYVVLTKLGVGSYTT